MSSISIKMHRRSTRFRKRRSTRNTMRRRATRVLRFINLIEGIREIVLSPLTQKFVECDIGNKINPVNPWIYVDKEKIETHLEYYQEESCFHPIMEEIQEFPNSAILVGSYMCDAKKPANFYICTTVGAERAILNMIERQRLSIIERVRKMHIREPGSEWESFGSEIEIQAEKSSNNRDLLLVDVNAIILVKQKTKFALRRVEDILNGYIEILPGRSTYQVVMRRRMDMGIQCGPLFKDKAVQIDCIAARISQGIQYCYDYIEIEMSDKLAINVRNFLQDSYRNIRNQLDNNVYMKLDVIEYEDSNPYPEARILYRPIEIKTYQDIIYCPGKKISCLSWNALISGIVAAAYVTTPLFHVYKGAPSLNTLRDPTEENYMALIWDYRNNVKPRLYLHACAEISSISFCPYSKYILVTGYTTGQIAVWDLSYGLNLVKTHRYRTMREQQNHIEIALITSWMKHPLEGKHIFPTITSKVEVSHSSPVTSISWIPPESLTKGSEEDITKEFVLKFITSELNGNVVCIWALDPNESQVKFPTVPKLKSLSKPRALTQGISNLKRFQARFAPLTKLYLTSLKTPKNKPMLKVIQRNALYQYMAENPDTLDDLYAETRFSVIDLMYPYNNSEKLLFATAFGVLQTALCVGPRCSSGQTSEICSSETLTAIHDGPILVCEMNSFFPDLLLTVGGFVFALWDCSKLRVLLWRKSRFRYLSGMWCLHRPLSVVLIRNDRHFEYWNVSERSETPIQIFKYKGYDPIHFYGMTNKFHMRKNTFIATDRVGAFKLLLLKSETKEQTEGDMAEAKDFLRRLLNLVQIREMQNRRPSRIQDDDSVEDIDSLKNFESTEMVVSKRNLLHQVEPPKTDTFQENLEQHGISVLLGLKGIRRETLHPVKMPITHTFPSEYVTKKLLKSKRIQKENTIEKIKDTILNKMQHSHRRKSKLSVDKDVANELKKKFIEDYKMIEDDIKSRIRTTRISKTVDFGRISERIQRYRDKKFIYKNRRSRVNSAYLDSKACSFSSDINVMNSMTNIFAYSSESIVMEDMK